MANIINIEDLRDCEIEFSDCQLIQVANDREAIKFVCVESTYHGYRQSVLTAINDEPTNLMRSDEFMHNYYYSV